MPGAGIINNANSQYGASVTNVSPRKLHYIELGKVKEADITESAPVCGNSAVEGTEQCDNGASNGVACTPTYNNSCNYCDINCNIVNVPMQQYCDDDIVNGPEQCDDGAVLNGVPCTPVYGSGCSYCTHTCTTANVAVQQWCGDGTCQASNENSTNCAADCGGTGGAGGIGGVGGAPGGGGGVGGEVVGGGGAGAGGNGTGGEVVGGGGTGGNGPDCAVTVTGAVNLESCDANGAVINATGPGTAKFEDKTLTINEVVNPCSYTITLPSRINLNSGNCGTKLSEPGTTTHKYFDGEYGDTLGAEGSEKETLIPAELNPLKGQGQVDIIAHKINSATHMIWAEAGCVPDNLAECQPRDIMVPGATKKGELPEGTILYKRLSDGMLTVNPADFNTTPPPTPADPGEDGGCTIAAARSPEDGSSNNGKLLGLALGAVLAVRRTRRKQD